MKRRRTKRVDRRAGVVRIKSSRRGKAPTAGKSTPPKKAVRTKKLTVRKKPAPQIDDRRAKRGQTPSEQRRRAPPHRKTDAGPTPVRPHRGGSCAKQIDNRRLQVALAVLREGKSAADAAREIGVPPEALRNYLTRTKLAKRRGNQWVISKKAAREWRVPSNGTIVTVVTDNPKTSRFLSAYFNHLQSFAGSNNPRDIGFFRGTSVTDIHGKRHHLETDPNVLRELMWLPDPSQIIYSIVPQQ